MSTSRFGTSRSTVSEIEASAMSRGALTATTNVTDGR